MLKVPVKFFFCPPKTGNLSSSMLSVSLLVFKYWDSWIFLAAQVYHSLLLAGKLTFVDGWRWLSSPVGTGKRSHSVLSLSMIHDKLVSLLVYSTFAKIPPY